MATVIAYSNEKKNLIISFFWFIGIEPVLFSLPEIN